MINYLVARLSNLFLTDLTAAAGLQMVLGIVGGSVGIAGSCVGNTGVRIGILLGSVDIVGRCFGIEQHCYCKEQYW